MALNTYAVSYADTGRVMGTVKAASRSQVWTAIDTLWVSIHPSSEHHPHMYYEVTLCDDPYLSSMKYRKWWKK